MNPYYLFGMVLGATVACALVTGVCLAVFKGIKNPLTRFLAASSAALLIEIVLATLGGADVVAYIIGQGIVTGLVLIVGWIKSGKLPD